MNQGRDFWNSLQIFSLPGHLSHWRACARHYQCPEPLPPLLPPPLFAPPPPARAVTAAAWSYTDRYARALSHTSHCRPRPELLPCLGSPIVRVDRALIQCPPIAVFLSALVSGPQALVQCNYHSYQCPGSILVSGTLP